MTLECLNNNEFFGIPYQGKTTLSELGSLVKVNQILKKYESGELDVLIECQSNFKIHHFQNKNEHKLYPGIGTLRVGASTSATGKRDKLILVLLYQTS